MSKIPHPWQCDECGSAKKPSNGWFIAWIENRETDDVKVVICKWNDKLADEENVSHICGIDCASRWQVKQLAKIYENQAQSNG